MAKELTESRRTRYTRRAMQDALIELLRNQPLGSITELFAYAALAVNQSQQLLLEADIRFRAHQYLQMLAIVGDVLADTFDDVLDAG